MLQEITEEKLKALASIYDTQDTFISLYLDVTHGIDWKFIEHRENQCTSVLKGDRYLSQIFHENMDKLQANLKKYIKTFSLIIFIRI